MLDCFKSTNLKWVVLDQSMLDISESSRLKHRLNKLKLLGRTRSSRYRVTSDRWEFVWEMNWGLRTINIVILNKGLSLLRFCVFRGEFLNSVTFWLYCVSPVTPCVTPCNSLWMELQWLADSYRQLACFKPYVRWPLLVHPRRRLDLCVHLPP